MNISNGAVIAGTGCSTDAANAWAQCLQVACDQFAISSPKALAAFLANVGVESNSLNQFTEDLNYSAQGLANTWPARFAVDPEADGKVPNAAATAIARMPQKIANDVYSNRLGNGPIGSGDGWAYRGRGPIQITGRANYQSCGAAIGVDLIGNPNALLMPEAGALSAAWFYASRGCVALAEAGDFAGVVRAINGASPCPANQGALRVGRYGDALAVLGAST
jgi:putative chitinase